MKPRLLTMNTGLYALAFTLALVVRFFALGQAPLSDAEAGLALQALDVSKGLTGQLGSQAAYVMLTGLLMFISNAVNWMARFWPAMAGSLFVLTPVLFREKLGSRAALVMAFWLALDPGLVAVSREAGSTMIAVCAVFAALGFVLARRPVWAGIAAGFALLSGPALWPGLISAGLGVWILGKKRSADEDVFDWRSAVLSAAVVFFLVGSLVFFHPGGLGAAAGSLPDYLRGWSRPSGVPIGVMLAALPAYEALALFLALLGLGRAIFRSDALDLKLAAWAGIALLVMVVYPARQIIDWSWALPPLLALASRQLARQFVVDPEDRAAMLGQALLTAVMVFFAWTSVLNLADIVDPSVPLTLQWGRFAASLVLLGIATFLVGWGWSVEAARDGLQWGITLVLGVFALSALFNGAGLSSRRAEMELWRSGPPFTQEELLLTTLRNFENWQPSLNTQLDIVVIGSQSSALRWALREFEGVSYVADLPVNAQPAVVISGMDFNMEQTAPYRGQDFYLWEKPFWDLLMGRDWLVWSVYRTALTDNQQIILWVRTDLFPGGDESAAGPQ